MLRNEGDVRYRRFFYIVFELQDIVPSDHKLLTAKNEPFRVDASRINTIYLAAAASQSFPNIFQPSLLQFIDRFPGGERTWLDNGQSPHVRKALRGENVEGLLRMHRFDV